ncbi:MAG: ATP-grasp domain-containing protein [Lachnospiraceae bacterium]|nr:ATP-grasp domain-containing protein [Lachnospiraceae bacterium]
MARLMVIAGGSWQCPIVKTAKEMGHYVLCTNLYADSPAFEFADASVVINVLDKEGNHRIAREYKPDAVLTEQTDIAVPTVAYVAEQCGLKGIGSDVAGRFTNKFRMREYASSAGIPMPKYRLCHSVDEAADFLSDMEMCIIKPIDSQSSRGIHIVKTRDEIAEYFDDCVQYSNADRAILIEEFIDGTEFTVDGVKTGSEYVVTAISQKDHYEYNPSVANRLVFTQQNDRYDYDSLRSENTRLIAAMGLPFGLTHTEYKYRDGKFYLIETAARGGGTKISSDITKLVSGIDCNRLYLNMLTGGSEEIIRGSKHDCAVLGFFDFKPGTITDIKGVEEALKQPGVHDMKLEVKVGDTLIQAQDDRSRCGYYILFADSLTELCDRERRLKETVKVITK